MISACLRKFGQADDLRQLLQNEAMIEAYCRFRAEPATSASFGPGLVPLMTITGILAPASTPLRHFNKSVRLLSLVRGLPRCRPADIRGAGAPRE